MPSPSRGELPLDVGEVLEAPGVRRRYPVTGSVAGAGLPSARVSEDEDVVLDLVVEAQGGSVIVEGTARAPWVGECRRCLERSSGEIEVELREVYEADPVEGETYPLVDEHIDLGPMVREAMTLALPLAPLCSEDCAGPDPEGHPVGAEDEPQGGLRERDDDPWAALDQLRFDD